jgi:hypothetical protein
MRFGPLLVVVVMFLFACNDAPLEPQDGGLDLRVGACATNSDCAAGTYCLERRNGCPTGDGGPWDDPPAWICVAIDWSPNFDCRVVGEILRCDCR